MDDSSAQGEASGFQWKRFLFLLLGALTVFLVVRHKAWFIQDLALWGTFLYALRLNISRPGVAWRNPAGYAALAVVAYTVIQIPFGVEPAVSGRLLLKQADLTAFALAMPFVFGTRPRIEIALVSAALAMTGVLGWDLARLVGMYGPEVAARARWSEPFLLNHPNTASMGAVMAIIVLAWAIWQNRRSIAAPALFVPALLISAAYLVIAGSRGPQIALLGSVAVAVFFAVGRRAKIVVILVVVACAAVLPLVNPRFHEIFSESGLVDRDKAWAHTWELSKDKPVAGYGPGEDVFMKVYHSSNPPSSPHYFHHPHQYWLNVLFTQGWIGVILLAAMWALLVTRLAARVMRPGASGRSLAMAVLAIVLSLHIYGMIDLPTNIAALAMLWIVPIALAATRGENVQ